MQKQLVYKENFISLELVNEIRNYFDKINDSLLASSGPFESSGHYLGWCGTWSRQLHFELPHNPIHLVVDKLKQEFGDFECQIDKCSIEYLSSPFLPHTDIHNFDYVKKLRANGNPKVYIFIIPLWWKPGHTPITGFFNSPPDPNEPLYEEMTDVFPKYVSSRLKESLNFSLRQMFPWKSPGDLIAWESFQWHCSGSTGDIEYSRTDWSKEFITMEVHIK